MKRAIISLFLIHSFTAQASLCPDFNKIITFLTSPAKKVAQKLKANKSTEQKMAASIDRRQGPDRRDPSRIGDEPDPRRLGPSRFDTQQREAINEIITEIGADNISALMRKYNPENKYKLSNPDKIYFAGIAKEMEDEILKANPTIPEFAKKRLVNKELKKIIKSCNGEGK